jgi:formylmethanofuran dehydrogenase subunit E
MKAISQCEHNKINSRKYPGTRQLCSKCDEPTGRCEEDSIYDENGNAICEDCYEEFIKENS